MANVAEITDATFQSKVADSATPSLVDFSATWCGPCKMLAPVVEDLAKEYQGKLNVYQMDIDNSQQTAAKMGIMSVPTVIFFKGGQEVSRVSGAVPKKVLDQHIQKVL
ncbi:MAG: thioredoxin [Planctomycetes bacterium RBG_16_59_8]|nr:MAG: thioredoxin [Planctomycetes bacterium RBG_16_59_8]